MHTQSSNMQSAMMTRRATSAGQQHTKGIQGGYQRHTRGTPCADQRHTKAYQGDAKNIRKADGVHQCAGQI